ncbi:hybrid sensor histidine kinase/response regulator [Roseiconus lacunae]|uniref:histidine kinase n=1 Tax=Roseiconus lacunae TaxID=2605694 RepID=A0ABT7PQV1_9BACT|nr:ATP-binding protein [Roseiconus lacunae]MDM4018716.1 ATP-binding protein [Roseiconus lacunae]
MMRSLRIACRWCCKRKSHCPWFGCLRYHKKQGSKARVDSGSSASLLFRLACLIAAWLVVASSLAPTRAYAQASAATSDQTFREGTSSSESTPSGGTNQLVATNLGQVASYYGHPTLSRVPVDIEASVNLWDHRTSDLFIEDQFDAIYIAATEKAFAVYPRLAPGTKIRVRGHLDVDDFFISADTIDVLDKQELKTSAPVILSELELGEFWSHYVRAEGELTELARMGSHWKALCGINDREFVIRRRDESSYFDWDRYLHRTVIATGTLSCEIDADGNPTRYFFQTNEADPPLALAAESTRQGPTTLPTEPTSIATVLQLPVGNRPVLIRGQVTEVVPNRHYLLEQDGNHLLVRSNIIQSAMVGNAVDAYVYQSGPNTFCNLYVLSRGQQSMPPPLTDVRQVDVNHLPLRVRLRGTLVTSHRAGNHSYLTLRDQGVDFVAKIDSVMSNLESLALPTARELSVSGTAVPVSGNAIASGGDVHPAFVIEVPSMTEIHVTARWWQFSPSIAIASLTIVAIACTVGMICFATLWLRLQRAADDNRNLQFQLVQSQKLDAIGRLTSGVAHDFNNLLTGIASNLELLQRSSNQPASESAENLRSAIRCTQQASRLVRSLLGFARQTKVELLPGDINRTVEETALLARSTFTKNITVTTKLAQNIPRCRFDQAQLGQVLLNLCFNAKDAYDGQRGTITIETQYQTDGNQGPGFAVIRCHDDGMGIAPEIRPRIFEPFFTTKKVGAGTGLGLSLSYGIVKQHHGTIECDSKVESGTTFTIRIPVMDQCDHPANAQSNQRSSSPQTIRRTDVAASPLIPDSHHLSETTDGHSDVMPSLHVMLVDDDHEVRRAAMLSLETLGHRVTPAVDGADAMSQLRNGLRPDVVLLDLIMPQVSGAETLERMKEHDQSLPVIICSGVINEVDERLEGCLARPDACIAKPFRLAYLDETLNQVCERTRIEQSPVS